MLSSHSAAILEQKYTSTRKTSFRFHHLLLLLLLLLLLIAISVTQTQLFVHGSLISSSSLQMCTRTSDEPEGCKRKLVVTITIDAEQKAGTEELLFLTSTTDETDQNNTITLQKPIYLTASRSVVVYRYPLYYVRDFNAKPYEEYIAGTLLNQCNADFQPQRATCGLAVDSKGNYIRYSEGYCCNCNSCVSAGFCASNGRMRGLCDLMGKYTAAWCLRFGEQWYRGYNIGRYLMSFNIELLVKTNSTINGTNISTQLHLSPSQVGASSPELGITTRLIGDLASYEQPMDLSQSMLFVPLPSRNKPQISNPISEWIILPSSKVTVDGRECNKVGVSYEAHYFSPQQCTSEVNSCLHNQLDDYLKQDKEAVISGRRGQYTAKQIADFEQLDDGFDNNFSSTGLHYIGYSLKSPPPTIITITIRADELVFVTPVSSGRIVNASLLHPTITASTRDGQMRVWTENTGNVTARYTLSIVNCTQYVFPILAQVLSLTPKEYKLSWFDVTVQEVSFTGVAQCTVALYNAVEELIDSRNVTWNVEANNPTNGSQGGTSNVDGATGMPGNSNSAACNNCGWLNFKCAFGKRCPKKISIQLTLIIGIVTALLLLCVFRRYLCGCCGCGLCFGSRRRGNKSHIEETVQVNVSEPTYSSQMAPAFAAMAEQKKMQQQMLLQLLAHQQRQQQQQQYLLLQPHSQGQQERRAFPNLITWNAVSGNNDKKDNNINQSSNDSTNTISGNEVLYYATPNYNKNCEPY